MFVVIKYFDFFFFVFEKFQCLKGFVLLKYTVYSQFWLLRPNRASQRRDGKIGRKGQGARATSQESRGVYKFILNPFTVKVLLLRIFFQNYIPKLGNAWVSIEPSLFFLSVSVLFE